jgi:hypothetical protein
MWQLVEYQLRRGHRINADQFVLVARCLELYFSYSDRFESLMRPPEEHRQLVAEVLDGMSPDLREREGGWIEQILLGSNRPVCSIRSGGFSTASAAKSSASVASRRTRGVRKDRSRHPQFLHSPAQRSTGSGARRPGLGRVESSPLVSPTCLPAARHGVRGARGGRDSGWSRADPLPHQGVAGPALLEGVAWGRRVLSGY